MCFLKIIVRASIQQAFDGGELRDIEKPHRLSDIEISVLGDMPRLLGISSAQCKFRFKCLENGQYRSVVFFPAIRSDLVKQAIGGDLIFLREVNIRQDETGLGHIRWIGCLSIIHHLQQAGFGCFSLILQVLCSTENVIGKDPGVDKGKIPDGS